jgi:hypothetical protein
MFILSYLVQGSCTCDAFHLVNLERAEMDSSWPVDFLYINKYIVAVNTQFYSLSHCCT